MRLPFQRDPKRDQQRDLRASSDHAPRGGETGDEAVAAARLSARRRLIGATALLAIGVAGFPWLFETEPRPLPANLPIVTAQNEPARASAPAARPASPRAPEAAAATSPASAPSARAPAAASAAEAAAPAAARAGAQSAQASAPTAAAAPTPVPAPPPPARAAPAPAPPATKPAPSRPPEPAVEGRFVVQVGAYADDATLRDTRQKVEKLGLKTYTQVIESDAGKRTRVRVGPYGTRAEAQAAAARLKAAGFPAALLTL